MLDRSYREAYRTIFREIQAASPEGTYDETAIPSYIHENRLMSWLFWKRIDAALSLAGDLVNKRVLDFGCGAGVTFRYFQECRSTIVGCDSHFPHLAEITCRRLGIKAEIYQDLLEIKERNFDAVFALDVLEHVDDPGSVIDHLAALSHEKTLFIISGPTENLFYRFGRSLAGFSGHYHLRNIYDIEKILRQRGLENRATKTLYFPIPLFRVSAWTPRGR